MNQKGKRRILGLIAFIGLIGIMMVMLTAYAAELRVDNNELIDRNKALKGEVDTLAVEIKTANNIDNIEKVAINKLGMIKPTSDQCVILKDSDKPRANFAKAIKRAAYN